ncbi:tudor domain-containing protein 7 isoform X2 [Homalodisca vitripennis]|uniref:tudor domain-containing protein 7 isoform X2 n=1 Tax=Homalodisca vitripennis TaxID=197043 RepID=UPI001EE9E4A2|nr:tudor domain-containing protein 7 isoform X2 [Homalodisca vitripennis]
MDDDVEGVVCNIRAVIKSHKGPMTVHSLMCDYKTIVGSPIPYQQLNFPTIELFLKSLPSLRVTGSGRDMMVEAAASSSSAHITSLISKQKSAKKKEYYPPSSRRGRPPTRQSYSTYGRQRGRGLPPLAAPRFQNNDNREEQMYYRKDEQYNYRREPTYYRREEHDNYSREQPDIVVKLEGNDKRQVSMGGGSNENKPSSHPKSTRPKSELPPRFRRMHQSGLHQDEVSQQMSLQSSSIHEVAKTKGESLYSNHSKNADIQQSSSIISPLGPGQLVAAGRAQQKAAISNYGEFSLDPFSIENKEQMNYDSAGMTQAFDLNLRLEEALNFQRPLMVDDSLSSQLEPNLSPQFQHVPVPAPDLQNMSANVHILLQYTTAQGWSNPEYKVFARKPKGEPKRFGAKVKITRSNQELKQCASYPFEDINENVAKGYAAKKALEEFQEEEKLVAGLDAGMFAKTVEGKYYDTFSESLPDNWIQTLTTCPTLSVESSLSDIIIVSKDFKLDPSHNQQMVVPEQLNLETLPEGSLGVYITHATSTCDVWCQIVGEMFSDKLADLTMEMQRYYNAEGAGELVLDVQVGQYYAARSSQSWFRVCVYEVKYDTREAEAWLIDHGDNETFKFNCLYRLPEQYCSLPRQALQIALEGLDSFSDDPIASEVVAISPFLIGKVLVGLITHIDTQTDFVKMTLFDTTDAKVDINVNDALLDEIYAKAEPQLVTEGCAMEVYVSSISKKGEVYIQIPGGACERLGEVLNSLSDEEISKHKLTSYRQVDTNKIYLAKFSKDEGWYRAVVTAKPSMQQNKIAVRFIDFGNAETVSISDIAEVENLPSILNKLPAQAVKLAMHNLPVNTLTNIEIAKIHSMLLNEEKEKTVLIKTVNLQEDPPLVEIFYKKDDDSALVSVNNTIVVQRLIKPIERRIHNDSQNGVQDPLSGKLKRPDLDGDFLDVLITLAAHPGNFIFQPLKYKSKLTSLMYQMQAYYQATALPEADTKYVIKGRLFAAQYIDETWYRVVVTEAIIGTKVAVRLCDYGDMTCVPVSNLRDLEEEFQRLPFMAIKGKLAGVVPLHTDWSVDDCVRFQNLVVDKPLTSNVTYIEENFEDPMETVVSLHLRDIQNEKEEVIKDILIKENRAVRNED